MQITKNEIEVFTSYIHDSLIHTGATRSEIRAFFTENADTYEQGRRIKRDLESLIWHDTKKEGPWTQKFFGQNLKHSCSMYHTSDNEDFEPVSGIEGLHMVKNKDSQILRDRESLRNTKSNVYRIDFRRPKRKLVINKDLGHWDPKTISMAVLCKIKNEYCEELDLYPSDVVFTECGVEVEFGAIEQKLELVISDPRSKTSFDTIWSTIFGSGKKEFGLIKYKNQFEGDGEEYSYIVSSREVFGFSEE